MGMAYAIYMLIIFCCQVRDAFSVDDYSHYLFTPRDLTQWVLGLLRYQVPADDSSLTPLLQVIVS